MKKIKKKNQLIASYVNNELIGKKRGRLCYSNYINALISVKEFMGENCKIYVEIGTLWGGTICTLLSLNDSKTTYIGVDLFSGYYGKELTKQSIKKYKSKSLKKEYEKIGCTNINKNTHLNFTKNTIKLFNKNNNDIYLIQGSSYDDHTVEKVKKICKNIDLLFIDGDHSEEGVKKDFFKYYNLVSRNGIIFFDNYGDPGWTGVKKGVDSIELEKYGFKTVTTVGYSLIILKK